MDISDLHKNMIQQLNDIFKANEGDKLVNFEVIETEIIAKPVESTKPSEPILLNDNEGEIDIENLEGNEIMADEMSEALPIIVEEVKRITTLEMPSRRLKIKISKELLLELEKMNVKFGLN
jgi:DNA polymerase-3 subunit alpha